MTREAIEKNLEDLKKLKKNFIQFQLDILNEDINYLRKEKQDTQNELLDLRQKRASADSNSPFHGTTFAFIVLSPFLIACATLW